VGESSRILGTPSEDAQVIQGVQFAEFMITDGKERDFEVVVGDGNGLLHGQLWISHSRQWRFLMTRDGFERRRVARALGIDGGGHGFYDFEKRIVVHFTPAMV
jgi:hypothetical protein